MPVPLPPCRRWRLDLWSAGTLLVALVVCLPVAAVAWMAFFPSENIWPHLMETVLPDYILTTLWLMLGVGLGTFVIGTATAGLVTLCRFPGSRVFEWALLTPLAIPAFVIAFVYTDLLDYGGPVQIALRALFGWKTPRDYWFPPVRSLGGAITMMTLVLYPYVYLLARSAFLEQSQAVLEVSRTLGCSPLRAFLRVGLPMARPSIAVGLALVLMEALNDFGTVDFFAVRTLSAGVFNVWLIMQNRGGGAQVALVLLTFILLLVWLERAGRQGRRYHESGTRSAPGAPAGADRLERRRGGAAVLPAAGARLSAAGRTADGVCHPAVFRQLDRCLLHAGPKQSGAVVHLGSRGAGDRAVSGLCGAAGAGYPVPALDGAAGLAGAMRCRGPCWRWGC